MSTFNKIGDVKDYVRYKTLIKAAIGRLREGSKTPFLYVEEFAFDDKERPMLLVDHVKDLVAAATATGSGKCSVNDKDQLRFDVERGKAPVAKLQRLLADAGVTRELFDSDANTSDAPIPDKLKMKYGWTEMVNWGPEAQSLIAKFDELVKLFKDVPEIPVERQDLLARFAQVKKDMADLAKSEIENDAEIRKAHQNLVEQRIAEVQALTADIATKPAVVQRQSQQPPSREKPRAPANPSGRPSGQTATTVDVAPTDNPQAKRQHEENAARKDELLKRLTGLRQRLDGFVKPPLHDKHSKEFKERLVDLAKAASASGAVDWGRLEKESGDLESSLEGWDALAEEYASQSADLEQLKAQVQPLLELSKAKAPLMTKDKKGEYAKLIAAIGKLKLPTVIYAEAPFTDAIMAYERTLAWLKDNVSPTAEDTEKDPRLKRMKTFVYDSPSTWDVQAVVYKNGTSAGDIGGKANDLATASLASNTTAGGSVLKVNFEGHAHLDGGSGGVAFVYKLNDDYTVTPTVVDTSSKRGGKNGNQYEWDTGGGWAYFPPNARY